MSKMKELSQMIEQLITCGEALVKTGQDLKAFYSSENEAVTAKPEPKMKEQDGTAPTAKAPAPEEVTYSKEEVRTLLAKKANEAGGQFKAQVKALVKKYGNGGNLTDIPANSYPALVKEVEDLKDA